MRALFLEEWTRREGLGYEPASHPQPLVSITCWDFFFLNAWLFQDNHFDFLAGVQSDLCGGSFPPPIHKLWGVGLLFVCRFWSGDYRSLPPFSPLVKITCSPSEQRTAGFFKFLMFFSTAHPELKQVQGLINHWGSDITGHSLDDAVICCFPLSSLTLLLLLFTTTGLTLNRVKP